MCKFHISQEYNLNIVIKIHFLLNVQCCLLLFGVKDI